MATLTLKTNITSFIMLNGSFLGKLNDNDEITVPFPKNDMLFCAIPTEKTYKQLTYCISDEKLMPCSGRLCRWSQDIYELIFQFEKESPLPPPIILKQDTWQDNTIGLCGRYFVIESSNGFNYFPEPVDDYQILSNDHVVLKKDNTVTVINRNMEKVFQRTDCIHHNISKGILSLNFTPGDMDFFTIEQIFDKKLISTKIIKADCSTTFDRLRCFCQAVRLDSNIDEFITPSLKSQMSRESIKEFLGVFDQTDYCKFLSRKVDNAVALRYMVDPYNYHYLCFEFTMINGLIDDISEL